MFVVSQGLKQLGKERADWADRLAGVMADALIWTHSDELVRATDELLGA